ncbi:MAG: hypothetical protein ACI9UQ_002221 [Candidatus Krumholzibacteriia bacterium]|jgi:hypothetical protein
MIPAILKNTSRFVMFALLVLIVGCGSSDSDPTAPGGGGGGGSGNYEVSVLTTGLGIHAVWGSDKNSMWAVGAGGLILHNDGTGWKKDQGLTFGSLGAIWGAAWNDIWAAGSSGALVHYDGNAWSSVTPPVLGSFNTMWGSASDDIWVGGAGGYLIHFDGTDWKEVESNTTRSITALTGASATEVWGACSRGTLITFDGTSWTESIVTVDNVELTNNFYGIWYAPDNGALYLTGNAQYLLTRQPSGEWIRSLAANNVAKYRIWGRSSTDYYMTDFGGSVHHWDGTRNFTSTVSSGTSLPGLFGVATGETYAVGLQGGVFHSDAGVQHWDIDMKGNGSTIFDVWGTASDNLELIAGDRNAFHYNGTDIFNYTVSTNAGFYRMWGAATGEAYSVGWGGISSLDGNRWIDSWTGTGLGYYGIGGLHNDFVVAVGDGGAVEARGPAGWQSLTPMGSETLRGVWVADEDHTFVVGDGGAVHDLGTIAFGGGGGKVGRTSWDSDDTGVTDSLVGIWGSSAENMFIISNVGHLLHFDGIEFTPSLEGQVGAFRSIWGSAEDDIWAVGAPGLAYHYDGTEWSKVETGTNLSINGVYGFGTSEIYFALDRGTLLKLVQTGS